VRAHDAPVDRVRVVLADVPGMLKSILERAASDDVELVDRADDLARTVAEVRPHAVIVGADDLELPDACMRVLEAHPDVTVLAIASRGRQTIVCDLLGEVSPERLLGAIRERIRSG